MTPTSPDPRWADTPTGRLLASRVHRPKALLVAEIYLVILALAVGRVVVAGLLDPSFLSSAANVPPFVADVAVRGPLPVAALGVPICLVPFALAGTRLPGRVPWSWTLLASAWLIIAFSEMLIASTDFTAAVLVLGAIPAALIGSSLTYLRRIAGQEWKVKWSRRRRVAITAVAVVVGGFWAAYLISGVLGMDFRFVTNGEYAGPYGP